LPPYLDKDNSTIKTQIASVKEKTGLHSIEAVVAAVLTRACIDALAYDVDGESHM
jgi:hypothetical protein